MNRSGSPRMLAITISRQKSSSSSAPHASVYSPTTPKRCANWNAREFAWSRAFPASRAFPKSPARTCKRKKQRWDTCSTESELALSAHRGCVPALAAAHELHYLVAISRLNARLAPSGPRQNLQIALDSHPPAIQAQLPQEIRDRRARFRAAVLSVHQNRYRCFHFLHPAAGTLGFARN